MASNFSNITKATFQADIKRKQALFNRFKKRFAVSHNPAERAFLKNEAGRIISELKQFSKRYQGCGFGGSTWITKGYTNMSFNTGSRMISGSTTRGGRKTTARKVGGRSTSSRRTGSKTSAGRTTWGRSSNRGSSARRTSVSRSSRRSNNGRSTGRTSYRSMTNRSMVAW